ncbi:hypothetical protein BY996DRAFT_6583001 [Phakopsora pachyrhizi]|uniref:Uncharacterized protein n=1 Tax=Phakopsora pachyrhizi TaxID=170000 RepID=A0AAV0AHT3_PHAPC|nr:hypothetical protein BY996DRAFT_6583001 [Phakopsora pachyrhizi]CAH7666899.1 hypothetical protein PPACK8108_LOCUS1265 [Phakopsora pachyrhizi]
MALQSQLKQILKPSKTDADTKILAAVQEHVLYLKKIFGTKGDPELTQVIVKLKTELDQQKEAVNVSSLCLFNAGLTIFAVEYSWLQCFIPRLLIFDHLGHFR